MDSEAELQFQEFGESKISDFKATKDAEGTTYEFEHSGNIGDREKLLGEEKRSGEFGSDPRGAPSFWTFEYYQQFFDMDTDQVLNRLMNSFVPRIGGNFITQHIRPSPDLYGPFWVAVTLVFSTAVFGNLAQYIQTAGVHKNEDLHYYWKCDFRIVTAAATAVFTYVCVVPLGLYAFLWYRKSDVGYSYLEILSAYGYSLTIFVPVSILWVINYDVARWALIGVAVFLSGSVLVITFWPAVKQDQTLVALLTVLAILGLHGLLAVGFKQYFFKSGEMTDSGRSFQTSAIPQVLQGPTSVHPPAMPQMPITASVSGKNVESVPTARISTGKTTNPQHPINTENRSASGQKKRSLKKAETSITLDLHKKPGIKRKRNKENI